MKLTDLHFMTCPNCSNSIEVLERSGGEDDRDWNRIRGKQHYNFFMRARCNGCFKLWEYEINIREV
jgi:hypothetical protein